MSSTSLPSLQGSPLQKLRSKRIQSFEEFGALRDDELDLVTGAWLIARDSYPAIELQKLIQELDCLAEPLVEREIAKLRPSEQARELARHLFTEGGFSGNKVDYYDPKNSLLPDVLRRRVGIPISLALVYVEVARRAGVQANGVNFPGHFLARIETDGTPLLVDPFNGGATLDQRALDAMLRTSSSASHSVTEEHTAPAQVRSQLIRMLINLKWIYGTRGDRGRALLTLTRLLALTPDAGAALRERGLLALALHNPELAREDLRKLVALQPAAKKDEIVANALARAESQKPLLH